MPKAEPEYTLPKGTRRPRCRTGASERRIDVFQSDGKGGRVLYQRDVPVWATSWFCGNGRHVVDFRGQLVLAHIQRQAPRSISVDVLGSGEAPWVGNVYDPVYPIVAYVLQGAAVVAPPPALPANVVPFRRPEPVPAKSKRSEQQERITAMLRELASRLGVRDI